MFELSRRAFFPTLASAGLMTGVTSARTFADTVKSLPGHIAWNSDYRHTVTIEPDDAGEPWCRVEIKETLAKSEFYPLFASVTPVTLVVKAAPYGFSRFAPKEIILGSGERFNLNPDYVCFWRYAPGSHGRVPIAAILPMVARHFNLPLGEVCGPRIHSGWEQMTARKTAAYFLSRFARLKRDDIVVCTGLHPAVIFDAVRHQHRYLGSEIERLEQAILHEARQKQWTL